MEENNSQPNATPPMNTSGVSKDERTFGMLAHLLGIFTGFIGPLVIWLVKREGNAFVDDQGKEALNFQISIALAFVAGWIVTFVLVRIPFLGCIVSLVFPAIMICNLIFCIMACIKANDGVKYRYPFALRLIK